MHTCVVCIGSNYKKAASIKLAVQRLTALFPGIRLSKIRETKPLLFKNPTLFSNQVVVFETTMDRDSVIAFLKNIEREAGRKPDDKQKEKVILDLDLVIFDSEILKPDEIQRDYILEGMKQLNLL